MTGPAEALALLLWGRTTPADERLTVDGDAAALDDALSRRLTPVTAQASRVICTWTSAACVPAPA